ncbi:OLC1v1023154C1 [Oldenlandia corymbosa var. corymbosa]|uniref:OLC1v1023154C1 n=1 Tax=Oldenlandia corymbosa var. corymbosa TaxID=529605 RepID=A0AAV1C0Z0_OLDCO|nr:OLC1v1023154C1 [Oldenlandia corymbosa var. corymbosa]
MELDRPHHRTTPSTSNSSSSSNTTANNNELFICFTSRLPSSSSMKIAKSILSPGRAARDSHISLSTSLSRRLRTNGSIKGGLASPMFPSVGKKRGAGLENPEPSSPKVTCIGQVRVKTKKKVKQTRSLSRRRSGDVSFRKLEHQPQDLLRNNSIEHQLHSSSSHFQQQECMPHRNQRWVHLPVTICEALRTFGAECLFPCRSSCSSNDERGKGEKGNNTNNVLGRGDSDGGESDGGSSCGAVFARWFVSLQDCEGGKGREIELVVGGEEEKTEVRQRISMRSSRRHVFEDMKFKEESIEVKAEGEEEEKARVSICIPPKNALLLMRCRSDPNKMADLTNRFWESPASAKDEDEPEEEDDCDEVNKDLKGLFVQVSDSTNEDKVNAEEGDEELLSAESNGGETEMLEKDSSLDAAEVQELEDMVDKEVQKDENLAAEMQESVDQEVRKGTNLMQELQEIGVEEMEEKPSSSVEESGLSDGSVESEEAESNLDAFEDLLGESTAESPIQWQVYHEEDEAERSPEIDTSFSYEQLTERETEEPVKEGTESEEKTEELTMEQDEEIPETSSFEDNKDNPTTALFASELKERENDHKEEDYALQESALREMEDEINKELEENGVMMEEKEEDHPSNVLPECLLLMMCEPKLSMEVSKETWVCSTDFIRWLPERPAKKKANNVLSSEENKKKPNNPPLPPPGPQQNQQQQREMTSQPQQERRRQQQMLQPPRSSCSLPAAAAVSMAAMIEQKLVNAVGYEPFVLTRCKSEPMRTAAAKLLPEACCWNNRKLEPHRNATFGVGAAGVGF